MANQVLADSDLFYFCRIDTSGRYLEVNKCFRNKFGHITDDFKGYPVKNTIHPEDVALTRQIFKACLDNPARTYRGHIRKPQRDGSYAYSDWEFCFNNLNPDHKYISAIGYDLTAREHQLQAIMKSTSDLILVLDRKGTYLEVFAQDASLLKDSPERLLNTTISDHFPKEEADKFLCLINQVYEKGELLNMQYDIEVKGGKKHYVANARLFSYNGRDCVAWSSRDFTKIKLYEEQLRHQNEQLKNIAFYQSHKVRGPLSNILGICSFIQSTGRENIDETMINYLKEAAEELDKVLHLTVEQTKEINI